MHQSILIIDFGSQFTQLIARRIRELNVYCEIHPFNHLPEIHSGVKGIILSGGPASVRDTDAPSIDTLALRGKLPVLGVCYGAQLIALQAGGKVQPSKTRVSFTKAHDSVLSGFAQVAAWSWLCTIRSVQLPIRAFFCEHNSVCAPHTR